MQLLFEWCNTLFITIIRYTVCVVYKHYIFRLIFVFISIFEGYFASDFLFMRRRLKEAKKKNPFSINDSISKHMWNARVFDFKQKLKKTNKIINMKRALTKSELKTTISCFFFLQQWQNKYKTLVWPKEKNHEEKTPLQWMLPENNHFFPCFFDTIINNVIVLYVLVVPIQLPIETITFILTIVIASEDEQKQ